MRILHAIPHMTPKHGGPPMIVARIAAAQAAMGHDVGLLYYDVRGDEEITAKALASVPDFGRVRKHVMPPQSRWESVTAGHARRVVRGLLADTDVLHLHSVWNPVMRVCAAEARRAGKPYVILLNGMLHPWALRAKWPKKPLALALGYRKMLKRAAALHLGNREEEQAIAPLRLETRGFIIPNGVFLSEIEPLPPADSFRAAHPELGDAPYMLFLGRLHYKKGLDYLADAFVLFARRKPDVRLVVAGPDDHDGTLPDLQRRLAAAPDVAGRVHLVGPQYGRDKLAALAGADCFVLTSRVEGFSVAITEAMGCGVPCIVTEGCNFPEVAEFGAGEVVPLRPDAIADAMQRVTSSPDLRRSMRQAGLALTRERYTWPRVAEMTLAMYDALR